jgi:hypothetical protein
MLIIATTLSFICVGYSSELSDSMMMEMMSTRSKSKFDGKKVIVRVFSEPEQNPSKYEMFSINVGEGDILDFHLYDFPEASVVMLLDKDQEDLEIKEALGNSIFVSGYKQASVVKLRQNDVSKKQIWTFRDALGSPIPNAHVKIYIHPDYKRKTGLLLDESTTDEVGQLISYSVDKGWEHASFIVSHPDYGTALNTGFAGYLPTHHEDVYLPLVLAGSNEDLTSVVGIVVDPENKPLSGIKIKCSQISALDEGAVLPLNQGIHYAVITEKDGTFRLYTPLSDHLEEQRGKYIPPKSKFLLHIEMLDNDKYRSYKGWNYNDKENVIQLEEKEITEFTEDHKPSEDGSYHTFIFKDENGREMALEQREKIELYIHQDNKPAIKLDCQDWQDGGMFPDGIYKASYSEKRVRTGIKVTYNFKPVEVDQKYPTEIIFELSDPITYVGQVVDGVTGFPLEGVFVMGMWGTVNGHNLSWLTQEQWDALHKLGQNPDVYDPSLRPIHEKYIFKTIHRTGPDGKFSMKALPEDKIWGCLAFEENYLPVKSDAINRMNRMEKKVEVFDFGKINLFPAGKIKFELVVPEKHVSITPKWNIDFNKSPSWAKKIKNIESRWLEENMPESVYVPAEVTFQLSFRMPYDDQWAPLKIDRVFRLDKGESIDIGKQHLQGSISIFVKVVDFEENPVEGVPVRLGQHVPHITDIDGRVKFYVPMYSGGRVGINYHSHDSEKKLRKQIIYAVKGKDDTNKEFMIKLTEQELSILFD